MILPPDLLFLVIVIVLIFTSADIIFLTFLELHSTLSEKKIFVTNFIFLKDSLKPTTPLRPKLQKSTKRDESFLLILPYCVV